VAGGGVVASEGDDTAALTEEPPDRCVIFSHMRPEPLTRVSRKRQRSWVALIAASGTPLVVWLLAASMRASSELNQMLGPPTAVWVGRDQKDSLFVVEEKSANLILKMKTPLERRGFRRMPPYRSDYAEYERGEDIVEIFRGKPSDVDSTNGLFFTVEPSSRFTIIRVMQSLNPLEVLIGIDPAGLSL
jgi:hypothetical protein